MKSGAAARNGLACLEKLRAGSGGWAELGRAGGSFAACLGAARPFRALHANERIVVQKSRHAAWWHQTPPFPLADSDPGQPLLLLLSLRSLPLASTAAVCSRQPKRRSQRPWSRNTGEPASQRGEAVGCPSWRATGRPGRAGAPLGPRLRGGNSRARLVSAAAPAWRRRPPLPGAPRLSARLLPLRLQARTELWEAFGKVCAPRAGRPPPRQGAPQAPAPWPAGRPRRRRPPGWLPPGEGAARASGRCGSSTWRSSGGSAPPTRSFPSWTRRKF